MSERVPNLAGCRQGLYPIRTLAALTGVNPVTLRAWERRHGLLRPARTAKGHRLYDDADVQLVRRIVGMLEEGIPISRAAALLQPLSLVGQRENGVWQVQQGRMRAAVAAFDEAAVDAQYAELLGLYPVDLVMDRLLIPLLESLGAAPPGAPGAIAEEHFLTSYVRHKLGARFHHQRLAADGPCLVTACLPDERHDMGLLLFGLAAASRGYRLVQLGADLPVPELAVVAGRVAPAALVLAGRGPQLSAALAGQLAELVRGTDTPVLIGGDVCTHAAGRLAQLGLVPLGNALQPALRRLDVLLRGAA